MALPYKEFATWTLRDQATRLKQEGRIEFRGNHIGIQYAVPVPSQGETSGEFAARLRDFWKEIPRHSDRSQRIALAFNALVLSGAKGFAAAHEILKILQTAPSAKRAEFQSWGIGYAYRPIEPWTGSPGRSYRKQKKIRDVTLEERQTEAIRVQASRFIRTHVNFDGLFDMWFGLFRAEYCRDADWYREAEGVYATRVAVFESRQRPVEWWAAMPIVSAAYLFHEQRKFVQALTYYRKAIRAAREATMREDFRSFVLGWMRIGAKLCLREAPMLRMPAYDGPRLPEKSSTPSPSGPHA